MLVRGRVLRMELVIYVIDLNFFGKTGLYIRLTFFDT